MIDILIKILNIYKFTNKKNIHKYNIVINKDIYHNIINNVINNNIHNSSIDIQIEIEKRKNVIKNHKKPNTSYRKKITKIEKKEKEIRRKEKNKIKIINKYADDNFKKEWAKKLAEQRNVKKQ